MTTNRDELLARARVIIADLEAADVPNVLLKHVQIAGRAFDLLREMIALPQRPEPKGEIPEGAAVAIGTISEYAGKTMNGEPIYALIANREWPTGTKVYGSPSASAVAEPVAWQALVTDRGWTPIAEHSVPTYREKGFQVRGLYVAQPAQAATVSDARDAARYRWIRERQGNGKLFEPGVRIEFYGDSLKGADRRPVVQPQGAALDAAIDAAIASSPTAPARVIPGSERG